MFKMIVSFLVILSPTWAQWSDQDVAKNLPPEKQARFLQLSTKKLHEMNGHVELAEYMNLRKAAFGSEQPPPEAGITHYALMGVGTPYSLNSSSFDLQRANCITWTERTVALGLVETWQDAVRLQNRLRYRDGLVGDPAAKNHRTLEDWVENNKWLWDEVTTALGIATEEMHWATREGDTLVRRSTLYIPKERFAATEPNLRSGDIILLVGGDPYSDSQTLSIGHVGLISVSPVNGAFLLDCAGSAAQSAKLSRLIEEAGDTKGLTGFKFVRLKPDARTRVAAELKRMAMPIVTAEEFDGKLSLKYDEIVSVDGKTYAKKTIRKGDTLWSLFGPRWREIMALPMNAELRNNSEWVDGRLTEVKEGTVVYFPWSGE